MLECGKSWREKCKIPPEFSRFGMIEILDRGNGQCAYYFTNWGKYQQESTAIEQRRLADKLRKQVSRSKA